MALFKFGQGLIAKGFLTALDDNLQSVGAKFDIVITIMLGEILSDALKCWVKFCPMP